MRHGRPSGERQQTNSKDSLAASYANMEQARSSRPFFGSVYSSDSSLILDGPDNFRILVETCRRLVYLVEDRWRRVRHFESKLESSSLTLAESRSAKRPTIFLPMSQSLLC